MYRWLIASMIVLAGNDAFGAEPIGQADVVVYGATPSGIAAAVAAAEAGATVVLVEPTHHVGGVVSSGLTMPDLRLKNAVGGFYRKYVQRVDAIYRQKYGDHSPQLKDFRKAFHGEPHLCEQALFAMLEEHTSRLHVWMQRRLLRTQTDGNRVTGIELEDLRVQDGASRRTQTVSAAVFVDASYEGDLAAQAGVRFQVGREGRHEYGETMAGKLYAYFGTTDLLPGSTGEADAGIQGYCYRFNVCNRPENRLPIHEPPGYRRDDYRHLADDIRSGRVRTIRDVVQFMPMPNGKFEINNEHPTSPTKGPSVSSDLAEENWKYPDATYAERVKIADRYWSYQIGLFYFMQNDPDIPASFRDDARQWGISKDEFVDNGGRPWQMYVRQARRIFGLYRVTEQDGTLVDGLERTRIQPTAVAIAEYPFDCHGVGKYDPAHPGVREGYFYLKHPPIQLPFEVMVPERIENLLVPVCCSATHVGYQTIRMEPVYMALGQAAGVAAAMAVTQKAPVRGIDVRDLQRRLLADGAAIAYLEDLPLDSPDSAPLQYLAINGWQPGYQSEAIMKLTTTETAPRLQRFLANRSIDWRPPAIIRDEPLTESTFLAWLNSAGLRPVRPPQGSDLTQQLTTIEAAKLLLLPQH